MLRTHHCGELTGKSAGTSVTLAGWVDSVRDMGGMIFIDMRDRYGITQVVIDPDTVDDTTMELAHGLKNEYVIQVCGIVSTRPASMINKDMPTGEIEIQADSVDVLNKCKVLPFQIEDDPRTSEIHRMKYRYLDLRRSPIIQNMKMRAQMNHFTRNWFVGQ